MSLAMEQAGVDPDTIEQIHVSANFSGELDRMEYDRLERAFGVNTASLRVIPLKYLTGDFGGAGTTRAAAILLSLHYQLPLPTVGAEMLKARPQHTLEWEICPGRKLQLALMTTSTFGGGSTSLVFVRN
jgi:3-oxoacyl-(acyl-carrier-protein) synthase